MLEIEFIMDGKKFIWLIPEIVNIIRIKTKQEKENASISITYYIKQILIEDAAEDNYLNYDLKTSQLAIIDFAVYWNYFDITNL